MDDKERIRQAFAERFRQALGEIGIAPTEQTRLQRLFGISGQAVRKWAEGGSMPTAARMPQVAAILGVRRAWLQDGDGPMRPRIGIGEEKAAWGDAAELSADEARLLARYRALTEEQRHALDTILAAMAGR